MTSPGFSNGRLRGAGNLPPLTSGKIWQGDGGGFPQEADLPILELEFPNKYMSFADPSYGAADYYVFPWAFARDSTNAVDLSVSGSTNVYTTVATNGILQSADLTGTISVTSGSATVTGVGTSFTSDFIVGDVIASSVGNNVITAIASNTSMTVRDSYGSTASGFSYKRGGKATSNHYYVYLVSVDGSSSNYATSTRNVAGGDTLVDLGSYVYYRQLPHVLTTDSSSNLYRVRWSKNMAIYTYSEASSTYQLVNAGTGGFNTVNAALFFPKTSRLANLYNQGYRSGGGGDVTIYYRETGSALTSGMLAGSGFNSSEQANCSSYTTVPMNSSQQFDYKALNTCNIYAAGYFITEMNG